jgi:hypothetical protein
MSAAFAGPGLMHGRRRQAPRRESAHRTPWWQRIAPWAAPFLTAMLLAGCAYLMFASHGASLI